MKPFARSERVGERIREELSAALTRRISDPRIGLVTITGVSMTRDLRIARIFYTVRGGEEDRKEARAALKGASGFLKREIGPNLGLRYMPDLQFRYDEVLEQGRKIEDLLRRVKETGGEKDGSSS